MKLKKFLAILLVVFILLVSTYNFVYALDADDFMIDLSADGTYEDEDNGNTQHASSEEEPSKEIANDENADDGSEPPSNEPQWTDVSNVQFSIEKNVIGGEFYNYFLKIDGLTRLDNHFYYAVVQNSPNLDTSSILKLKHPDEYDGIHTLQTDNNIFTRNLNSNVEKNADIYIWLFDHVISSKYTVTTKELISAKKIERPTMPSLGLRMQTYFFNDRTTLFVKPFPIQPGRKISVKIGTIADVEILKAIRDEKNGSLNSLLNYSKSANSFYENTFEWGSNDTNYTEVAGITSNLPITTYGFYYVYMSLDDEGGTYYPLEDVGLYQGLNNDISGKSLYDYYSQKDKFNWDALAGGEPNTETPDPKPDPAPDPEPKPSTDNTVATTILPNTGINTIFLGIIFVIITIIIFSYIKIKELKEIK